MLFLKACSVTICMRQALAWKFPQCLLTGKVLINNIEQNNSFTKDLKATKTWCLDSFSKYLLNHTVFRFSRLLDTFDLVIKMELRYIFILCVHAYTSKRYYLECI